MSRTNDPFCRLLEQVVRADEPLAHPSLEDVADSVVRDYVRSMVDRGLVEGELHTTPGGRWTVYPGLQITRSGRSYLSRRLDGLDGGRNTADRAHRGATGDAEEALLR